MFCTHFHSHCSPILPQITLSYSSTDSLINAPRDQVNLSYKYFRNSYRALAIVAGLDAMD